MGELYPVITAVGGYLPADRVTNTELIERTGIDSTPEWIAERTGIEERRWAATHETTSYMAVQAARQALERAAVAPSRVGQLLLATLTPDYPLPGSGIAVHGELQLSVDCQTLDIGAACAGSVAALELAVNRLRHETKGRALVVGSEVMTSVVNPENRATSVIFGDGAGALLVEARDTSVEPIFCSFTVADREAIYIPKGGVVENVLHPDDPGRFIAMNGRSVAKYAKEWLPRCARELAAKAGMAASDKIFWEEVDTVVFHQANLRLIEAAVEVLEIPEEKVVLTVQKHGNTSAASIPLALNDAYEQGQLTGKRSAMLLSIGAGFAVAGARIGLDLPAPAVTSRQ